MEHKNLDQIDLVTPYNPTAIYYADGDYVEYVRRDDPIVYRRVDEFLTLALDMFSRDLVGFRLKGFRNFFLNELSRRHQVTDGAFIPLVSVLEEAVEEVGEKAVEENERTRAAYASARLIALEDNAVARMPVAA
ncbi:hypothetical protein [Aestuariivirga sp.]|jgi:hypothetical protein|uniref:hypothetical protein n=1 Tax=Aestuariivirga sp. TaxID=2650926 RepID=UPI003783AAD2